jgi:hypothetical protein
MKVGIFLQEKSQLKYKNISFFKKPHLSETNADRYIGIDLTGLLQVICNL